MQAYQQCQCPPPPPLWFGVMMYALFALLLVGACLIVRKWLTKDWPPMSPAQCLGAYGLSLGIIALMRMNQWTLAAGRVIWVSALLIVVTHAANAVTVWLLHPVAQPKPRGSRDLFESLCYFLPRDVREAFWADWKEDRRAMIAAGYGPWFLRWVLVSRVAWEVGAFFKGEIRDLIVHIVVGIMKPRL